MLPMPSEALGRLNAHARSGHHYGQRDAIYSYKLLAAMVLVTAGAQPQFVKWTGKCNRCDNGRFSHWDWEDGYTVACRDCGGSGTRTLRFTVTTTPEGHVWHHPWEGRTMPGHRIAQAVGARMDDSGRYFIADAELQWADSGEWQPNLPAKAIQLDELVQTLNTVEDWVAAVQPDFRYEWQLEQAQRELSISGHTCMNGEPTHGYKLDLGKIGEGCHVCAVAEGLESSRLGCYSHHFHWSVAVCKAHRELGWPKHPPESVITPAIRYWMDRHRVCA